MVTSSDVSILRQEKILFGIIPLFLSIFLSVCLSVRRMSISQSMRRSICLPACLFVSPFACLFNRVSVCQPVGFLSH